MVCASCPLRCPLALLLSLAALCSAARQLVLPPTGVFTYQTTGGGLAVVAPGREVAGARPRGSLSAVALDDCLHACLEDEACDWVEYCDTEVRQDEAVWNNTAPIGSSMPSRVSWPLWLSCG